MTTTQDPWATLPTDWRTRPLTTPTTHATKSPPPPTPRRRRTPPLKLPDPPCQPWCATCGQLEPTNTATDGPQWTDQNGEYLTKRPHTYRHPCGCGTWTCDHIAQAGRNPICLVTRRARARVATGATGRQLLAVDLCPHCGRSHIHSIEPTTPYRVAGCGQPYLIERTTQ
jgi:hypothetical protein